MKKVKGVEFAVLTYADDEVVKEGHGLIVEDLSPSMLRIDPLAYKMLVETMMSGIDPSKHYLAARIGKDYLKVDKERDGHGVVYLDKRRWWTGLIGTPPVGMWVDPAEHLPDHNQIVLVLTAENTMAFWGFVDMGESGRLWVAVEDALPHPLDEALLWAPLNTIEWGKVPIIYD